MQIQSLVLRSELLFVERSSEMHDLDNMLLFTTLHNHGWWGGNWVVLETPPTHEEIPELHTRIEQALKRYSPKSHFVLLWQSGELSEDSKAAFAEMGFGYDVSQALTLGGLPESGPLNPNVEVREVSATDTLWNELLDMNVECFAAPNDQGRYAMLTKQRFGEYRKLIAKGSGTYCAAFIDNQLAGSYGLFRGDADQSGPGFYRYQQVAVRENFRRQGVARTMLRHGAIAAHEAHPDFPQLILADINDSAQSLYRSLGFNPYSVSEAILGRKTAPKSTRPPLPNLNVPLVKR